MRSVVEGMSDSGSGMKRIVYADTVSTLLALFVALVILSFVGKLLWNSVVVELIGVAKPAKSLFQILGLMLFVNLLCPC